jgi:dolichol-phosphate mannosyltransferase
MKSPQAALLRRLFDQPLARFLAVGFSGVFVNLGLLAVFVEALHLRDTVASALAIELSILWNFALNNAFTFRERNRDASAGYVARMIRYNLIGLVGLGIQLGAFVLLNGAVVRLLDRAEPGPWRYPSQCAGIVLATGWNYATNVLWTWRQKKPVADREAA